jgi:ribulose 1,5-bisphosphate synthetase/thiazole synthase
MAAPVLGVAAGAATAEARPRVVRSRAEMKNAIRTQVLVVGAGASGVPAAIAAARTGAKVLLLEDDQVPGGAPVDMYVSMPCGGPQVGIYAEMVKAMDRDFHLRGEPREKVKVGPFFMPSAYVAVISRMIRAESNIVMRCSAPVTDVLVSEGSRNRIRGVTVRRFDGNIETIEADVVIDATGFGLVAALAGCECRYGTEARSEFNEPVGPEKPTDQVQLCTLMLLNQRVLPDAKFDGSKLTGMVCYGDGHNANLQWAGTVRCQDTLSLAAITKSYQEALQKVEKDVAYLYKCGFATHAAPKLGVRETRRVVGDYVMTVNDLISPKRAEDTVAVGTYPLDAWGDDHGSMGKAKLSLTPGGYGIPLRSLLAKGMENLMVVGKCLSATHLAMSAVRVQPIAAQMGQAAGVTAALAVSKGTNLRSVSLKAIQSKLKAGGIPI